MASKRSHFHQPLLNLNTQGTSLSRQSLTLFLRCGEIIVYKLVTENNLIWNDKILIT